MGVGVTLLTTAHPAPPTKGYHVPIVLPRQTNYDHRGGHRLLPLVLVIVIAVVVHCHDDDTIGVDVVPRRFLVVDCYCDESERR